MKDDNSNLRDMLIAVEGPCCAGKTTLSNAILSTEFGEKFSYIKDFSDFVGGGRNLPEPFPGSKLEELEAISELLEVEDQRFHGGAGLHGPLLWVDRSIHTVAAHSMGLEACLGYKCFEDVLQLLVASPMARWPSIVYYLDVANATAKSRNTGKFEEKSLFLDPTFNSGFRSYFCSEAFRGTGQVELVWIDADLDAESVMRIVLDDLTARIEDLL